MLPGYAIDNNCAIHFVDGSLLRAISTAEGSFVSHSFIADEEFISDEIEPVPLFEEENLKKYILDTPLHGI